MSWLRRSRRRIQEGAKSEVPSGLWSKCPGCGEILYNKELERNLRVCENCDFHFLLSTGEYIGLLTDPDSWEETHRGITSEDPLSFKDSKRYRDRLKDAVKKTGLEEAVVTGRARLCGTEISLAILDFSFLGGSMGSVVGEKIARAIEDSLDRAIPLLIISRSGGARMQESILSLMQMAKTSALLARLHRRGIPFVSILTNPTTGGVTASFASLGDLVLAEPKALIGFAGPRVIQQTINQELPEGFQRSEFLLEHGFVDAIVPRQELKARLAEALDFLYGEAQRRDRSEEEDLDVEHEQQAKIRVLR
jgi:acetyl-CoA carboxylase carboxyl transferase subunit beta